MFEAIRNRVEIPLAGQAQRGGAAEPNSAAALAQAWRGLDLLERVAALRSHISGRIVFTTSFGLEDQAIAHAIFAQNLALEVVTLDTGRLFPQTHQVWAETEARYGARIRVYAPGQDALEALITRDGINGFRSSVAARLDCCAVRKVAPLNRALSGCAAWITGTRADQSAERAGLGLVSFDDQRRLIKANPLFDWTRKRPSHSCVRTAFPTTRCTIAAFFRSAARPARARPPWANRSAPDAGGGSKQKRRNAACTCDAAHGAAPASAFRNA